MCFFLKIMNTSTASQNMETYWLETWRTKKLNGNYIYCFLYTHHISYFISSTLFTDTAVSLAAKYYVLINSYWFVMEMTSQMKLQIVTIISCNNTQMVYNSFILLSKNVSVKITNSPNLTIFYLASDIYCFLHTSHLIFHFKHDLQGHGFYLVTKY